MIGPAAGSLGDPAAVPLLPGRVLLAGGLALPAGWPCRVLPGPAAVRQAPLRGHAPRLDLVARDKSCGRADYGGHVQWSPAPAVDMSSFEVHERA